MPLPNLTPLTMIEGLGAVLAAAILIIAGFFKEKFTAMAKKHFDFLFAKKTVSKDVIRKERRINEVLIELRIVANADRSYIFKFHNGEYFSLNDPIWKVTCTNETVKVGISYQIQHLRNILASMVADFISPLFSPEIPIPGLYVLDHKLTGCDPLCEIPKTIVICKVVEMENTSVKAMLQEQGIQKLMMTPLRHRGQTLGFVGIDYCSEDEIDIAVTAPRLCQASTTLELLMYVH